MISRTKFVDYLSAMQEVHLEDSVSRWKGMVTHTSRVEDAIDRMILMSKVITAVGMYKPGGVRWRQALELYQNRKGEHKPLDGWDLGFVLRKHPEWMGCGKVPFANGPIFEILKRSPMTIKLSEGVKVRKDGQWVDEVELWMPSLIPGAEGSGCYLGVLDPLSPPAYLIKEQLDEVTFSCFYVSWPELVGGYVNESLTTAGGSPDLDTNGTGIDEFSLYSIQRFQGFGDSFEEPDGQGGTFTLQEVINSESIQEIDFFNDENSYVELANDERDKSLNDVQWGLAVLPVEPKTVFTPGTNPTVESVKPTIPQNIGKPLQRPNGGTVGKAIGILSLIEGLDLLLEHYAATQNQQSVGVRTRRRTQNKNCIEAIEDKLETWQESQDFAERVQEKALEQSNGNSRYRTKRSSKKNP